MNFNGFKLNIAIALLGAIAGVFIQKYWSVGNVLHQFHSFWYRRDYITSRTEEFEIPRRLQGELPLFILAGQSNMSGRGEFSGKAEANERIFLFGNDYRWQLAVEPIDASQNQVDPISQDSWVGIGPGYAFAKATLENSDLNAIGLIPCAMGDTSIKDWERSLSENTLYGSCLKRARAASVMGRVEAILWFQGETDAAREIGKFGDDGDVKTWDDSFELLVESWREDLGDPTLPILFAQIGRNEAPEIFPNWTDIQQQQASVHLKFTKMIVTEDLQLKDFVHFNTKSYVEIGERFSEAYLSLDN